MLALCGCVCKLVAQRKICLQDYVLKAGLQIFVTSLVQICNSQTDYPVVGLYPDKEPGVLPDECK